MKILFFADLSSIHGARWINQLHGTDWEIAIMQPVCPVTYIHEEFIAKNLYYPMKNNAMKRRDSHRAFVINTAFTKISRLYPPLFQRIYTRLIAETIKEMNPNVIHSLGLNVNWKNQCLPVLKAKKLLNNTLPCPWLYSSWGSDLDVYARLSKGTCAEVKNILHNVDVYIAECHRDLRLAKEFGYENAFGGFFPAFGGVPREVIESAKKNFIPPSKRKKIFLKGRDNTYGEDPIGRAMLAINAFDECSDLLSDFEIVIAQPSNSIKDRIRTLSLDKKIKVKLLKYESYYTILSLLKESRLFISLTSNDGLPSSLVEAMTYGAFPIHSDLESIREWIYQGKNGFLVPITRTEDPKKYLEIALQDDDMVDHAASMNIQIIEALLSERVIKPRTIDMYSKVAE